MRPIPNPADFAEPSLGRVAILIHSHPSLSKGGAEIAAETLFRGLRETGVDAILIACCPIDKRAELDLGPDEYAIFYDPTRYDELYHLASQDIRQQLLAILLREEVTLLNAHHFLHVGVAALEDVADAGIRLVVTLHEFLGICHNHGQMITRVTRLLCEQASPRACHACFPDTTRQQFAMRRVVFQRAFERVQSFISPSHFLAKRFIDWGLPTERVRVIENGIVKRATLPCNEIDMDQRVWRFGFFGQINPFKGIDVILGACALVARLPELTERIQIVIHGNVIGQSEAFIAEFDAALKLYPFLTYAGPYDNAVVTRLMSACDYVLAPSSWWENSPVVIQEAYHSGRPVICTGIGGLAEKVIDGVSGLHFKRNDSASLVSRLVQAVDVKLYEHLCAGLPPVYDSVDMAASYAAVFAEALAMQVDQPPTHRESHTDHAPYAVAGE